MSTYYLLPCSCGNKTAVAANQAGLTVRCTCGTELAVPGMRGLAALERVEAPRAAAADEPAASSWGARQGLMFLGSIIVSGGALAALALWVLAIPTPISLTANYREHSREMIGSLSADDLIARWNDYRKGIEQEPMEHAVSSYEALFAERVQWVMVAGGIGCLGLLLVITGMLIPAKAGPQGR